ncbi:hypothetical protein ACRALDRAFT_1092498 [Sodiomyces alcalophilus JCM 7366]|uniref:uncharacterized protein n=1 Tax=Sodiomyces alcalophilus JCM 7366 TaxID=591952 RepID=UPI0039B41F26
MDSWARAEDKPAAASTSPKISRLPSVHAFYWEPYGNYVPLIFPWLNRLSSTKPDGQTRQSIEYTRPLHLSTPVQRWPASNALANCATEDADLNCKPDIDLRLKMVGRGQELEPSTTWVGSATIQYRYPVQMTLRNSGIPVVPSHDMTAKFPCILTLALRNPLAFPTAMCEKRHARNVILRRISTTCGQTTRRLGRFGQGHDSQQFMMSNSKRVRCVTSRQGKGDTPLKVPVLGRDDSLIVPFRRRDVRCMYVRHCALHMRRKQLISHRSTGLSTSILSIQHASVMHVPLNVRCTPYAGTQYPGSIGVHIGVLLANIQRTHQCKYIHRLDSFVPLLYNKTPILNILLLNRRRHKHIPFQYYCCATATAIPESGSSQTPQADQSTRQDRTERIAPGDRGLTWEQTGLSNDLLDIPSAVVAVKADWTPMLRQGSGVDPEFFHPGLVSAVDLLRYPYPVSARHCGRQQEDMDCGSFHGAKNDGITATALLAISLLRQASIRASGRGRDMPSPLSSGLDLFLSWADEEPSQQPRRTRRVSLGSPEATHFPPSTCLMNRYAAEFHHASSLPTCCVSGFRSPLEFSGAVSGFPPSLDRNLLNLHRPLMSTPLMS